MRKFHSLRACTLMTLATRSQGVSPKEIEEGNHREVAKTCVKLAQAGLVSWKRISRTESRIWATAEQYAAWLIVSTPQAKQPAIAKPASPLRPDGTLKDPKRVAAALKGKLPKTGPAVMVAKSTGASWDRSAPARITSETKVTIWKPRTQAEWIADVAA